MLNVFKVSEKTQQKILASKSALDEIRQNIDTEQRTDKKFSEFSLWLFNSMLEKITCEFEDYFFENIEKGGEYDE